MSHREHGEHRECLRNLRVSVFSVALTFRIGSKQNIFIAAKHLAELKDVDFKGKKAGQMTLGDIKVTATRYNRGPDLSIEKIKSNMSYGESIIKRFGELYKILHD